MPGSILFTERLHLRLTEPRDRALYRALYSCREVMAAIGPCLAVDVIDSAFERVCRHNSLASPGHRFWTVDSRSGEALGLTALQRRGAGAELGIMLYRTAWNRGIAREAFTALLPYAFEDMGLTYVEAEREDDAQARIVDRLLVPFGFDRARPSRPRAARWLLYPGRAAAPPDPRVGIGAVRE